MTGVDALNLIPVQSSGDHGADSSPAAGNLKEELADVLPLIAHSSDLITVVDSTGVMVYASPAHEQVLGYTPEELEGTLLLEYVHPDDVAKARTAFTRVCAAPAEVPNFEIRVRHKDGSYRWLLSTLSNQLDHSVLQGIVVNCRHITERKDAQDALSWESDLNSAIAELAQALISSVSLSSISRMVLKEAQKLTDSALGFVGYIDLETGHRVMASVAGEVGPAGGVVDRSIEYEAMGELLRWTLEHRRPLITNDLDEGSGLNGMPEDHVPIQHFMVAPALIGDTLMGQIALANPGHPYSGRDLSAVKRLASLYAIAVEAQRSREALHRYAEEQAALYSIGAAVASLRTADAVIDTVIEAVVSTLEAEAGWISVPEDGESGGPGGVSGYDIPEAFKQRMASAGFCPVMASMMAWNDEVRDDDIVTMCEHIPFQLIRDDIDYWACVPIVVGGRLIASLTLLWKRPRALATNHGLLQAIGRQIGVALENARLYREAQQADQLRVLNALGRALQATLNPEEIARVTLAHATRALDTSGGTFVTCESKDSLCFKTRLSEDQGWQKSPLSNQEKDRFSVLRMQLEAREKTTHLVRQLDSNPNGEVAPVIQGGAAGDLIAPLVSDQSIGGLLILDARSDGRDFTEEDQALASTIANQVSQMLQNAQLYQASRKQTERLRTLNRVSGFAAASLEPDAILQRILTQSGQAFDVEEATILLLVDDGGRRRDRSPQPKVSEIAFKAVLAHQELIGRRIPEHQGIVGWVVQHNESLIVNDAQNDRRFYSGIDALTGFKTRSVLCVPLRVHHQAIGAIEMLNKRDGPFAQDDVDLLEAVAAIASVALDNARLYTRTRDRAEELSVLNEFSRVLASTLDSERLVKAAIDQIAERYRADGVALVQKDEEQGMLRLVQGRFQGVYQRPSVRVSVDDSLAGWVYTEQRPLLVPDAQMDPRSPVVDAIHVGVRPHAMMIVPLIVKECVIGVLLVASQRRGVFGDEDLQALQALASTLSVALENARLYEDLRVLLEERERTQAMMIHTEKMAALGRLGASLAHEINNPLQAVLGCLTLAREELDEAPNFLCGDREVASYIDIAEGEIDRISDIVHRMRNFYRPARDGVQRTDIHKILGKVLELSTTQLERNQVVVTRDWTADLPEIYATPDHMMQVFLNLLLNAVDAMPGGGELTIRTRRGDGDAEKLGVRIEFEDSGVGIDPEILSRIFEPFFTTKPRGSGLGLSISYSIIQAHNGEIRVASRPGEGTTFTLLLPFGKVKERQRT